MLKQKMPLALIHQALAAIVLVSSDIAHAQTGAAAYRTKPVKLVVGFAAGGPTDVVARAFADHASRALGNGWSVLLRVDNVGGKDYQTIRGYATPGRTFYAGLKWAPQ
mgnify:CR=1 FL=1